MGEMDFNGGSAGRRWPGPALLATVAVSYLACVAVATYPVVLTFTTDLPGYLSDPLAHLWLMRWSRASLFEGHSPFFCPGLQYPLGVPLGYYPTMHLQTALYLALGVFTSNDVVRFNIIWFFGFVSTGIGTYLLAWWVIRRSWPAWLAGLGAMLCGPMLLHAHGHLEAIQMGALPVFLIAWIRFVDAPSKTRLAASLGLYFLVVACAPYFALLAVFPAAWYVGWLAIVGPVEGRRAWLIGRTPWLLAFAWASLPGLAILFSSQLWASWHGYPMTRPRAEFNWFGAPLWSYVVPAPLHQLGKHLAPGAYESSGYGGRLYECSSYLGVLTLALLAYSAARRVRFPRAGYWWTLLAMMVVMSCGAKAWIGSHEISLPAGWLYRVFPPFHLIRVPARFNLFVAICAAVPVAAGVRDLLGRMRRTGPRVAFLATCAVATLLDLSMVPFPTSSIPAMPAFYREIARQEPRTALVDAPMMESGRGHVLASLWAYWQSQHLASTTSGYSAITNVAYDKEILETSPWALGRLADPSYLANPARESFGPVLDASFRDYCWLYLTAHHLDHVVLHQDPVTSSAFPTSYARLKAESAASMSFESHEAAIYERSRMRPPEAPTVVCLEGWRRGRKPLGSWTFGVMRRARLALYNPTPGRPLSLTLDGLSAFARSRTVRLLDGDRELARWTVSPGQARDAVTPPLQVGEGVQILTLESDGDSKPAHHDEQIDDIKTPYSLKLVGVRVGPVSDGSVASFPGKAIR